MVLCLRLAAGKIRKYRTSYLGPGESTTYRTKCGMSWNCRPKPEEECDHLDCALAAAEHKAFGSLLFLAFSLLFIIWGSRSGMIWTIFQGDWGILLEVIGVLILAFNVYTLYRSSMDKKELTEFRDKGTIGGVRAWKDLGSKKEEV